MTNVIDLQTRAPRGAIVVMPVTGHSMIPTYRPGDFVIVDTTQREFTGDSVYAIRVGGREQIRRVHVVPEAVPTLLRIMPDNPAYVPDLVAKSRLEIVGRVCGILNRA